MAKWNDNIDRYKKSKRYKFRQANSRKNRYRQSQLRLSEIAVKIADEPAINITPNQGSEWVRAGMESPERPQNISGNASPNKSDATSEGSSSLYNLLSLSSYYYSAAWSWLIPSARGQLFDLGTSCEEFRERSLSMTLPR